MYDYLIRHAVIIDGTGSERRSGDIAVEEGRIVSIGHVSGTARHVIDAQGQAVCPGFIDVHTHYDAQALWDPSLSPSSLHGVTSIIGGNCGFTLAPITEEASSYITRMLARVEGMPLESLEQAVDFSWSSFGEYISKLEGQLSVNAGFLVGHSTIRKLVLGEDVARPADPSEIERMVELVDRSISEGALGFSSSWGEGHLDDTGAPVPSRWATSDEVRTLSAVVSRHPGTWLEFIPTSAPFFEQKHVDLMTEMSLASSRALNWNLLQARPGIPSDSYRNRLSASDHAADHGAAVFALGLPEPMPLRVGFETCYILDSIDGWDEVAKVSRNQRLLLLQRDDVRARLDMAAAASDRYWSKLDDLIVEQTASHRFGNVEGRSLGSLAQKVGSRAIDIMCDLAVDDRLSTVFVVPGGEDDEDSWRKRSMFWSDPRVIIGGSDAGAHVDTLATFGFFTNLIGPTVRDRGLLNLEMAVSKVTSEPARRFGLTRRGTVTEGHFADLVIFDPQTIGRGPVAMRRDFPGSAARLYAAASGISHVLVNGVVTVHDGTWTGATPGVILRSGINTHTVPLSP